MKTLSCIWWSYILSRGGDSRNQKKRMEGEGVEANSQSLLGMKRREGKLLFSFHILYQTPFNNMHHHNYSILL